MKAERKLDDGWKDLMRLELFNRYLFQIQYLPWGRKRIGKHGFGGHGGHGTMFLVFGIAFKFGRL